MGRVLRSVLNETWIASFKNLTDSNPIAAILATLKNGANKRQRTVFSQWCYKWQNFLWFPNSQVSSFWGVTVVARFEESDHQWIFSNR